MAIKILKVMEITAIVMVPLKVIWVDMVRKIKVVTIKAPRGIIKDREVTTTKDLVTIIVVVMEVHRDAAALPSMAIDMVDLLNTEDLHIKVDITKDMALLKEDGLIFPRACHHNMVVLLMAYQVRILQVFLLVVLVVVAIVLTADIILVLDGINW